MSIDIWLHPNGGGNTKILYYGVSERVYDIISCTHAISRAFGREPAIKNWGQNAYVEVVVPTFCELVEEVFRHPQVLTFNWARIVTSLYEAIQEEAFIWEWPVSKLPNWVGAWIDQDYVAITPYYAGPEMEDKVRSAEKMSSRQRIRGITADDKSLVTFSARANGKMLGSIPARDARLFYEMSLGLASFVGLPTACLEIRNNACLVEEEIFSRLVERIATTRLDIYFQWLRLAIAVYDNLHEVHPIWRCEEAGGILEEGTASPITIEPLRLLAGRDIPYDETIILPPEGSPLDWGYVLGPEE
jgi:hypothetical protein